MLCYEIDTQSINGLTAVIGHRQLPVGDGHTQLVKGLTRQPPAGDVSVLLADTSQHRPVPSSHDCYRASDDRRVA